MFTNAKHERRKASMYKGKEKASGAPLRPQNHAEGQNQSLC